MVARGYANSETIQFFEKYPDSRMECLPEIEELYQRNKIATYIDSEVVEAVQLWSDYNRFKTLPYSGGFLEQPYRVIEYLRIVIDGFKAYKNYKTQNNGKK